MEAQHEQEIRRLVNVLRRTARMASQAYWGVGADPAGQSHTAQYAAGQYNRILGRLKEVDPTIGAVFGPLADDAPLDVVNMACRQLVAYYEEELDAIDEREGRPHRRRHWGSFYETAYEAGPFKILFGRGFKDLEELGRMIRECMPTWIRGEECCPEAKESKPSEGEEDTTQAKTCGDESD